MFDHSVYITASYLAAAIVLAWCAIAPVMKTKKTKAKLVREISRRQQGNSE